MVDRNYMLRALELAAKGKGRTGTNPLVGAVLVRDGKIIGEGYHHKFGGDHAEIDAIKNAGNAAQSIAGADLYVTLEPCSHHGKTPPCVDALKASEIKRVITAMPDPNPLVSGKGLRILRESGIEVESGIEREHSEKLNKPYLKYLRTGLPWVTLKIAQTLDGKIADTSGDSKWITSAASRKRVHEIRSQVDAVIIGAGTARHDNPSLTTHGRSDNNPRRIIIASNDESISQELGLIKYNTDQRTIIAVAGNEDCVTVVNGGPTRIDKWTVTSDVDQVDLGALLRMCATQHMGRVLVEGGASLFTQFVEAKLADEIVFVVSPKLLGKGLSGFNSSLERRITETLPLEVTNSFQLGGDIWIETEVTH